jgi:hypothetical protein
MTDQFVKQTDYAELLTEKGELEDKNTRLNQRLRTIQDESYAQGREDERRDYLSDRVITIIPSRVQRRDTVTTYIFTKIVDDATRTWVRYFQPPPGIYHPYGCQMIEILKTGKVEVINDSVENIITMAEQTPGRLFEFIKKS